LSNIIYYYSLPESSFFFKALSLSSGTFFLATEQAVPQKSFFAAKELFFNFFKYGQKLPCRIASQKISFEFQIDGMV